MKKIFSILLCLLFLLPLSASAQSEQTTQTINPDGSFTNTTSGTSTSGDPYQYQRQGIFDCNRNGSYAMSVGAFSAIGGAYVPVADATVELNTGTLVYKECILREVIDRERESALSAFLKKQYQAIQTGRNGNPQYVQNQGTELVVDVSDPVVLNALQGTAAASINQNFRSGAVRAVAQNYSTNTRSPQDELGCQYNGDPSAYSQGSSGSIWQALSALQNPNCNSYGAYFSFQQYVNNQIATAAQYQQNQWNWGRGYYPGVDANGNVITPASTVQGLFEQLLSSPVRQLENANDIGQMIGALYAGVTTQVISDSGGLAGLSQSAGGQSSYLDQVVSESAASLRNAAANVALNILGAAQAIEKAYFQAMNTTATALTTAISQLRTGENQCWNLVIQNVCDSTLTSGNTCQGKNGSTLHVATSTVFSQAVIDANIKDLATSTAANIQASQTALQLINSLIAGVTNTNSLDAQRVSLQQLDSLVAQHKLHTQPDLDVANQQASNVQDTMQTLVQNTVKDWADGTPNGSSFSASNQTGWCNVNVQTTLDIWANTWKQ
jgi:hypothetical protein